MWSPVVLFRGLCPRLWNKTWKSLSNRVIVVNTILKLKITQSIFTTLSTAYVHDSRHPQFVGDLSSVWGSLSGLHAMLIVECPMIDHVRWLIIHFVGHPLNHVDDVMRCFCSIFNYWSLVARAATCGIFLLKSNDVQTRNLWEGHFLCEFTYIPSIELAW